jgi:hypothetical protein
MTADKTQGEGNGIIAEFDGWNKHGNRFVKSGRYMAEDGEHEWERSVKETEFSYHKNWSLLMPVVEKISKIRTDWENATIQDTYYPRTFGMTSPEGKTMVRINSSQLFEADTLIEATWFAVIDFIKWYNTNSK